MEFILDVVKYESEKIYIKDTIADKSYFIGYSIFLNLIKDKDNYLKFKNGLINKSIETITIYNQEGKILEINKIVFLEGLFDYLTKNNLSKQDLLSIYENLKKIDIDKSNKYNLDIDNKNYSFLISDYWEFLNLPDDLYNKVISESTYKSIKLEYFIYSLVSYFKEYNLFSKYVFSDLIKKRFVNILQFKNVDFESINKYLVTKDNLLSKIQLSSDINTILNKKYDDNLLKNIIKCYINLCSNLNYDEVYYIDAFNKEGLKHHDYKYLSQITNKNNKIVCFEFTSIFGYFLNNLGIKYEILGSNDYGIHSFLIFRLDKYIIKVEAIKSVFENDLTNVRIKFPLEGIECINQNKDTQDEFNNILDECYKSSLVDFANDYLPANKVNNNIGYTNLNDYILKIDLIFKKIKDLNLSVVDKLSYFKILIKLVFSSRELELNVFYTTLTSFKDIVFIIVLNTISYQNLDNVYLIYENNNLSFISKEELENRINNNELDYLSNKEIPGIKRKIR